MNKFDCKSIKPFYLNQVVDIQDFNQKSLKETVQIYCGNCGDAHGVIKKYFIISYIKQYNSVNLNYKKCCSKLCVDLFLNRKITKETNCPVCNTIFKTVDNKKFCSRSCSAKYNNKNRVYSDKAMENLINSGKINSVKNFKKINPPRYEKDSNQNYKLKCKVCQKIFFHKTYARKTCSDECYKIDNKINRELGFQIYRNSPHKKSGRSYNEIYFFKLVKEIFPNATNNKFIFNGYDADVIIPDLKLAIHWNGIWHYKPVINESHFKQICKRDLERYQEIEKCGYTNYIIQDLKSVKDYDFVQLEFTKLLNILGITQSQPTWR